MVVSNWSSTEQILGLNPFDCNYFVIKINEFIYTILWRNSFASVFSAVAEPWKSLISGNCLEPETVFPSSASFSTTFRLNYNTDSCSTYSDNQVEISIRFNETVACNDAKVNSTSTFSMHRHASIP